MGGGPLSQSKFFLVLFLVAQSCAPKSRSIRENQPEAGPPSQVPGSPSTNSQPSTSSDPLSPIDGVIPAVGGPINIPKPESGKSFAVWIDSDALDSFEALGFLQALEKNNMKPAGVAGVGMGCWIALAWGLEGNGNRAEWQAFKWNQWDSVEKSLFSNLGLRNAKRKFTDQVQVWFSARHFQNLSMPVDCPLLARKEQTALRSARGFGIDEVLWWQFQTPLFGTSFQDSSADNLNSGTLAGLPTPSELDDFAEWMGKKDRVETWIVLQTRAPEAINSSGDPMPTVIGPRRNTYSLPREGTTPAGVSWTRVNLLSLGYQKTDSKKDFRKRRAYTLEGRKKAVDFLKRWSQ